MGFDLSYIGIRDFALLQIIPNARGLLRAGELTKY